MRALTPRFDRRPTSAVHQVPRVLVADVIDGLKPHRGRDEAVATCIDYFTANKDRMRYDRCRDRGLPVDSGAVESA